MFLMRFEFNHTNICIPFVLLRNLMQASFIWKKKKQNMHVLRVHKPSTSLLQQGSGQKRQWYEGLMRMGQPNVLSNPRLTPSQERPA